MKFNFVNIVSLFLFISGFLIFFLNAFNFNLKKNLIHTSNNITVNKDEIINFKKIDKIKEVKIETKKITNLEKKNLNKIEITVKDGQTFSQLLDNYNLNNKKKFEIIDSINKFFNLNKLKIGQKIIFFYNNIGELKKIIIELDFRTNLIVNLNQEIFVNKQELKTSLIIESKEYSITSSIYSDGISNDLPNEILIKLIQLFSFDIDFQRDIKKNTKVSISYEKIITKKKSGYSFGDISYARININNKIFEYFKFITDEGYVDYFNREGKNVKKSILKTPLDGAKLSSNFGMRKHPISGFNKMHKGVDFAAPIGTPIYAGGNGVIEFVGLNGGYGKYIRIRHNNDYKTAYAHLNGYKKGIKKGTRVNQGDVIGYVGNTGRSTGPHLHYEIIYQNKQINPLTLKLPSGKILEGDELKRFTKNYKMILADHLHNLFE